MKAIYLLVASCCVALLLSLATPLALADQWNQATKLTFSQPVEIPGVVLPAGTYWFTLISDDQDRNIVQVWNQDRNHLMATLLTEPDYRLKPAGRTIVRFEERASTQPEAIRAWFYPGETYGHEFVYPESRARELAKRTGQPVLSMRDEEASNITKPATSAKDSSVVIMKQAHIEAVNSSGQEVDKSAAIQSVPQNSNQMPASQR